MLTVGPQDDRFAFSVCLEHHGKGVAELETRQRTEDFTDKAHCIDLVVMENKCPWSQRSVALEPWFLWGSRRRGVRGICRN
jgi:hypothetical protein